MKGTTKQYDLSATASTNIAQGYTLNTKARETLRSDPADIPAKYLSSEPVERNQALVSEADLTVCLEASPEQP